MPIRPAIPREIPALCTVCGNIFNTHFGFFRFPVYNIAGRDVEIDDGTSEIFEIGGQVGCPVCGNVANFRCDLFKFVDDIFEDLKKLGKPQIIYLTELLSNFKSKEKSPENLDQLDQEARKQGIYIFGKVVRDNIQEIGVLIALITLAVTIYAQSIDNTKDQNDSIVIENIYVQGLKQESRQVEYKPEVKPSMRKLCPCGSGKKFKNCCGKINKHTKY